MDHVLALIPRRYHDKAKAIIALLFAILVAVSEAIPTAPNWLTVVITVFGAVAVYSVPAPGYTYPLPEKE